MLFSFGGGIEYRQLDLAQRIKEYKHVAGHAREVYREGVMLMQDVHLVDLYQRVAQLVGWRSGEQVLDRAQQGLAILWVIDNA